jgi:hypothetical protein
MVRFKPGSKAYTIGFRADDGSLVGITASGIDSIAVMATHELVGHWQVEARCHNSIEDLGDNQGSIPVGFWPKDDPTRFACVGLVQFEVRVGEPGQIGQLHVRMHVEEVGLDEFAKASQGPTKGRKARQLRAVRAALLPWDPSNMLVKAGYHLAVTTMDGGQNFSIVVSQPRQDEQIVAINLNAESMVAQVSKLLRRRFLR